MKDVLAIVGSHPVTRGDMDFTRQDCDIWVFNEAMSTSWATRADIVFQMHEEAIWRNPLNRNDPNHYAWLTGGQTPPVYMQEQFSEVPKSVKYPLEEVVADLLSNQHLYKDGERKPLKYFASSVDYAVALGIHRGYKVIEIYGVELSTETEYTYQRAGFGFWCGLAAGRGVSLELHTSIYDFPLYGYEGEVMLDYEVFDKRIADIRPVVEQIRPQYEKQQEAVREAFEAVVEEGTKESADKFIELLNIQKQLGQQVSKLDGQIQENDKYKNKADAMRQAAETFLFSRQEFEGAYRDLQTRIAEESNLANISGGRCEVIFTSLVKTDKAKNRRKRAGEFAAQMSEHLKHLFYAALYAGAMEENVRFMQTLDAHIKAAGGSKSEAVLLDAMR